MSFSTQISGFGTKASENIQGIRRASTIKLFNSVILDTPVDAGPLRGNWQVTEGAPAVGVLDTTKEGHIPSTQKNRPGDGPINTQAALDRVIDLVPATLGDVPVFLTNNLPYANRVEFEGWSHTKAPEGMVRRNITRFGNIVKSVRATFR